jgi:hypothetical protein
MDLPNKSEPQQPKKHITPVISGAVQVPRPASRRFKEFLFQESPKNLGAKIGRDIIVPRIKAGVEEAINSFLAGMLWGNGARPGSQIVSGTVLRPGGVQYHQISQAGGAIAPAQNTTSSGNYQDLVCPSQQEAETLLAQMYDTLNQYRVVAVADLYEMARIKPAISDNAYGWTNLDGARITKTRDGYCLELPRPTVI